MATVELTAENFEESISEGLVLVDFWAEWCAPCKRFAPVYERVSEKFPDATFTKVDTEANPELIDKYGVRSMPTVMAFRDGEKVFSRAGILPESALVEVINSLK